jgi:hypothetical protein
MISLLPEPLRVLVIHYLNKFSRQTSIEFTRAFGMPAKHIEVNYANIFGFSAALMDSASYDLAIVTTEVSSLRSFPYWTDIEKRILRLSKQAKQTVILTQDDYTYSSRIDALVDKGAFASIWSPLAENLSELYPSASTLGVRFEKCLTGYATVSLDDYSGLAKAFSDRSVDLGQRVSNLPEVFGEIGSRKAKLAVALASEFERRGFAVDVSTKPEDVFVGQDWLRFLGNCRFTVSRKGGASLADPFNHMTSSIQRIRSDLPFLSSSVSFALASKRRVLAGEWVAESPRIFEAAAMGVCQILEEDTYLGGSMVPWRHYIPIAQDFANLNDIFHFISDEQKVQAMVLDCKALLIESGQYSYASFVDGFLKKELDGYMAAPQVSSVVIDLDIDSETKFDSARESVPAYFAQSSMWQLFRDSLRDDPPTPLRNFRTLNSLENIPEVFSEPWVNVLSFGKFV